MNYLKKKLNKKGNGFVLALITGVILVLLVANFMIPVVKDTTTTYSYTDSYARTNNSLNQSTTLTHTPTSLTSVTNGTITLVNGNYTLSGANLTFMDNKAPVTTYLINYQYVASNYLTNAGERSLMAVVILGAIVGIVYFLFKVFGLA